MIKLSPFHNITNQFIIYSTFKRIYLIIYVFSGQYYTWPQVQVNIIRDCYRLNSQFFFSFFVFLFFLVLIDLGIVNYLY